MRRIRRSWWLLATAVAGVAVGVLLATPVWAAVARQGDAPSAGDPAAMHQACVAGDAAAMRSAMGALSDEDWEAMAEHMATHMASQMADGHHGALGESMMGSEGMTGGHMGDGMTNGMMGGGSGSGMMDAGTGMMGGMMTGQPAQGMMGQ